MIDTLPKPRLTRFEDVLLVVRELKKLGIADNQLYTRITEIGPVDLDMLKEVLWVEPLAA